MREQDCSCLAPWACNDPGTPVCAWTVTRHCQTVTVYPSAPAPQTVTMYPSALAPQTVTVYPSALALQIVTMYPSAPAPVTVYPFTPG